MANSFNKIVQTEHFQVFLVLNIEFCAKISQDHPRLMVGGLQQETSTSGACLFPSSLPDSLYIIVQHDMLEFIDRKSVV